MAVNKRLVVFVVSVLAVCLCSGLLVLARPSSASALSSADVAAAAQILDSSWARDGRTGFFIDYAGPPGTPISLYDTAWWIEAANLKHVTPVPVTKSAVATWLPYVLTDAGGDADTAGMAALERLDDLTMLSDRLGIRLDAQAVRVQLESLRSGALYRTSAKDKAASYGATSDALAILHRVGIAPPDAVSRSVSSEIPRALGDRRLGDLLSFTVPILTSMTPQQIAANAQPVRTQLQWMHSLLGSMTAFQRVSLAAALHQLVIAATGSAWPATPVCEGIQAVPGGVAVNGSAADPHATADAVRAGCQISVSLPPAVPAGWPNAEALAYAPAASYAGYELAVLTGRSALYRPLLVHQLESTWLGDASANSPLALSVLSAELGVSSPPPPDFADQLTTAISTDGPAGLPALAAASLNGTKVRQQGRVGGASVGPSANVYAAAADEYRYRLTGLSQYRTASRSILGKLSLPNSLYAESVADVPQQKPSLVATAIFAWAYDRRLSPGTIRVGGFCRVHLRCSLSPTSAENAPVYPLEAAAIMAQAATGAAPRFPMLA
jgi:hypothetical protein